MITRKTLEFSVPILVSCLIWAVLLAPVVYAIAWRDTDDQVYNDIAGPEAFRTWQFKDIMADRRAAEQLERIADELSLMNEKLTAQAQINMAIQAMFSTTIASNSAAFRELVAAVDVIAGNPL